jgi:hypothetical protein
MTGNEERKISSLRDLPLDIAPPRDLWQGIEAQLAPRGARESGSRDGAPRDGVGSARRFGRQGRMRILAAAAMIAALAVGIWIGRAVLPLPGKPPAGTGLTASHNGSSNEPSAWHAAYVMDSKYTRQRAVLVKDIEARIAALPPESRAKVISSLRAIDDSKRALEAELGKDPSNALLQELLVNTYQDEMRVLTAVHEAGRAVGGV